MEYAARFLVHCRVPYDGKLDVEEYIDDGIVQLATEGDVAGTTDLFQGTFGLLADAAGNDALRRIEGGKASGRVTLGAFEAIAVGVGRNLAAIRQQANPTSFVRERIQEFWAQPELANFTSPGLRGTIRIQRTVPFGDRWFRP